MPFNRQWSDFQIESIVQPRGGPSLIAADGAFAGSELGVWPEAPLPHTSEVVRRKDADSTPEAWSDWHSP